MIDMFALFMIVSGFWCWFIGVPALQRHAQAEITKRLAVALTQNTKGERT